MNHVEATHSTEVRFYMHVTSLCLCVRVYLVVTGTVILSICNWGHFVTGGKLFWGAFCIRGIFLGGASVLGGF